MDTWIDASSAPPPDLRKEVHAHFGLCMYFAQVFETGLINILTALETAQSKVPTREAFEASYVRHESFTFGNLMKALAAHKFLPNDIEKEAYGLKADRDHLAHRFFREHDLDELTVGGCYAMIEELEARRERFRALDKRVSQLETEAFVRLGFNPQQLAFLERKHKSEMLDEARARYSAKVAAD